MTANFQRLKVGAALAIVFASGVCGGWFGRQARQESAPPPPPPPLGSWTGRALAALRTELGLAPDQEAALAPVLAAAAQRMELDRERALFQIHLQVLQAHDEIRPHLRPDQLPELERMRARLEREIKRRFAGFLTDPAQPSPEP
jgi:hypothetical protein